MFSSSNQTLVLVRLFKELELVIGLPSNVWYNKSYGNRKNQSYECAL